MSITYEEFKKFVEKSELMAVVSAEKKADILERYKNFSGEQLTEAVRIIGEHEDRWGMVKNENQKRLAEAGQNLNKALQAAKGRVIENIHEKEAHSRKGEEEILASLEDELNNLSK